MSKTISTTVPDRVHAALANHAKRELDVEPSEFLKLFLTAAAMTPDGQKLNLELPPVTAPENEPELPLT